MKSKDLEARQAEFEPPTDISKREHDIPTFVEVFPICNEFSGQVLHALGNIQQNQIGFFIRTPLGNVFGVYCDFTNNKRGYA